MLSHPFAIRTSIEPTTPLTVMLNFRLTVESHLLIMCLHGKPEPILLKASVWDCQGICMLGVVLEKR